jgi:hypothetical protein
MRAQHPLRLVAAAAMIVALVEGLGCALLADIDLPATTNCTNGKADADKGELGVDCGGICRGACPGSVCVKDTDCASFRCDNSRCASPECADKIWNGVETDIDCGGSNTICPRCEIDKHCLTGSDCRSSVCEGGACSACKRCGEFIKTSPLADPSKLCEKISYANLIKCCNTSSCRNFCGSMCERVDTPECRLCVDKSSFSFCSSSYKACFAQN